MSADTEGMYTGVATRVPSEENHGVALDDEEERRRRAAGRITERDLLWVESVSERLLGPTEGGRAWERVYFEGEPAEIAADSDRPERPANSPDPALAGAPEVAQPAAAPTLSEADADWAWDPAPGHIDLTQTPPIAAAIRAEDLEGEVLRIVLATGDATLAAAVMQLLGERARDKTRIGSLETALRAVLDQVGDRLPAIAPLRRVLDH